MGNGTKKKRDKVNEQAGEHATTESNTMQQTVHSNRSINVIQSGGYDGPSDVKPAVNSTKFCNVHQLGGFDGPSDEKDQASLTGSSGHPMGPSLGYDPARNRPPSTEEVPRRLELPAEAYRDPGSIAPNLPLRPVDPNPVGKKIQVRVNQFKVSTWPQKTVYQYDVFVGSGLEKRGLIKLVWNSKPVQDELRKWAPSWLFDGNRIAWSTANMHHPPDGEWRLLLDLDKEKGKSPRIDKVSGHPVPNTIRIRMKKVGEIRMSVIQAYLDGTIDFNNTVLEAINFLDHCMRQWPTEIYTQIKRSFFSRGETRHPLDNVVEAVKGVYSSIRLCQPIGSSGASTGLAVNVDVANSTFWTCQALHQCARNLCKTRNRNLEYSVFSKLLLPVYDPNLPEKWTWSDDFKDLRRIAGSRLKFRVNHRGKIGDPRIYTIKDFCWDAKYGKEGANAKNVKFMTGNPPREISVYDYFVEKYEIRLQHWYLPLVKTERDGTFPMEVCTVLPDQQYKFKCDPNQTASMIKFCVTRPKNRIKAVEHGIGMLKWHEDPYMAHYGLKIDPKMTTTNARVIQNPEVQFATGKVNPGTSGRWDLRGKKFFAPNPEPLKSWGVCVLDPNIDTPTLQNFLKVFIQTYTGHGGKVENRQPYISNYAQKDLADAVEETMKKTADQCKMQPQILLFVLRDKNNQNYERLKKNMECRFGIVSQMMQAAQIRSANPQYCSNVCMKLNAKLGGTTCRIVSKNPKNSDFFSVPTMILGADVSHPSPGSPQASMAAVSMSLDGNACRYAVAVQTNGYRVEMIKKQNFYSMFRNLFPYWIKTCGGGKGPSHIYYFRDGVSEGQYLHVLEQEVRAMKSFIADTWGILIAAGIKFTVIVASKRHHLRFFPKEGDMQAGDRNGNPLPGTIVDRDITHPFQYDYYLCSHVAIQGTARPTHYHVILDEANIPPGKLQTMIYHHCYQYMRSTTPVSLYPAVYYAHLGSNRARAHENSPNKIGPRGGSQFLQIEREKSILANARGEIPVPAHYAPLDDQPEAPPLVPLGVGVDDQKTKEVIHTSMWYI